MPVVRLDLVGVDRPVVQIRRALVFDDPGRICTPDWLTASSTNRTWPSSSSSSSCSYGIAGMVTLNVFSAKAA